MKENKIHGSGTLRYACGDVYKGNWIHGRRNGPGTLKYADGRIFNGMWKNDEIDVFATLYHTGSLP